MSPDCPLEKPRCFTPAGGVGARLAHSPAPVSTQTEAVALRSAPGLGTESAGGLPEPSRQSRAPRALTAPGAAPLPETHLGPPWRFGGSGAPWVGFLFPPAAGTSVFSNLLKPFPLVHLSPDPQTVLLLSAHVLASLCVKKSLTIRGRGSAISARCHLYLEVRLDCIFF